MLCEKFQNDWKNNKYVWEKRYFARFEFAYIATIPDSRSIHVYAHMYGPIDNVIYTRAGQDQGGPRWDTLTKKSKSTKLLHIVLCYTQGVVAYDLVLFGGCIPSPLTPLQVKPEALILISIGGRTLQFGVMYIFLFSCVTKIDFYHLLWNWQIKRLIKQNKKEIEMCLFVFENKFEHVTSNTQFRLAQIRVATFLHNMLQVCHRGKSSHKSSVTIWNDGIWHGEIVLKIS